MVTVLILFRPDRNLKIEKISSDQNQKSMEHKNTNTREIYKARTIGSFFLLAFVAYGFGRSLVESESYSAKYPGALLILANSLMVLFIGILFRRTLHQYNSMVGNLYLATRVFESLALATIALNVIPSVQISDGYGYFSAMLVLGVGSIPMCVTLYKQRLSPSWLAIWGVTGYAIFAFGFLMELLGRVWSMYLLIPGGLWEITFASWLLIKGGRVEKATAN